MTDCQCTQYVANHFGIGGYPDAKDWSGGYLQKNGFHKVDVRVGAIAVMQPSFPYVDQTYGHVGIVEQIEGNDILVRGANQWAGTTPFSENGCNNVRLTKFGPINRGDISFWVRGGSPGSRVYPNAKVDSNNNWQNWEIKQGKPGCFLIINKLSGAALDGGGDNGTKVYPNGSVDFNNTWQNWEIKQSQPGYSLIINRMSNAALDGGGENGTKVYPNGSVDTNNTWQNWEIKQGQSGYSLIINKKSGAALDGGGS